MSDGVSWHRWLQILSLLLPDGCQVAETQVLHSKPCEWSVERTVRAGNPPTLCYRATSGFEEHVWCQDFEPPFDYELVSAMDQAFDEWGVCEAQGERKPFAYVVARAKTYRDRRKQARVEQVQDCEAKLRASLTAEEIELKDADSQD